MFGVYSNRRLSEAERKLLCNEPDDSIWYSMIMTNLFRESRFFHIREDIELPQSEDDDGVVLIYQGGDVVYFKTLDGNITKEVHQSVFEVCSYLEEMFDRPITAYVALQYDAELESADIECEGDITILYAALRNDDGEEIVERLHGKLKNHEDFTIQDSIDHMILPFSGYKDKKVFKEKFNEYMNLFNEYGG
jgi:hypothetical protein